MALRRAVVLGLPLALGASVACEQILSLDDLVVGADAGADVFAPDPHDASDARDDADGGTSCAPATAWPAMFSAPIAPPFHAMGLDLQGESDGGITIGELLRETCGARDGGDQSPGSHMVSYGDAGEVQIVY